MRKKSQLTNETHTHDQYQKPNPSKMDGLPDLDIAIRNSAVVVML